MPGRRQSNAKWGLIVLCLLLSLTALCDPSFAADRRQEILDQQVGCVITDPDLIAELQALNAQQTWVELNYTRFDVFIDSVFYDQHTPRIDDFFDKFALRHDLLETRTGWSAEESSGNRMKIWVDQDPTNCAFGGTTLSSEIFLFFYHDFTYGTNLPSCKRDYYENGTPQLGNSGELGDHWIYMQLALHEGTHAITPHPILRRAWLREGLAEYYGYNILADYGDINQETADIYIYEEASAYNWPDYVANDYRDFNNITIQESAGYDITAWMFSMLKNDYSLDWNIFYGILNNNLESLEKADSFWMTSAYYTDHFILDVFGKALGHTDFDTQTKPIFRYDGPAGPGWGVRNFENLDWYADLSVRVSVSDTIANHETIIDVFATVYNTGATNIESVSVIITIDTNLYYEEFIDVGANDSVTVSTQHFVFAEYNNISATVDMNNIKIELDETNNSDSMTGILGCCFDAGDADDAGDTNIGDATFIVKYIFQGGDTPSCLDQADADGSNDVNIGDATWIVKFIFQGGDPPVCGTTGI